MEIAIGLFIGFAIGCTGVGGGTLTAPALILFLSLPPRASVATALLFSAVVKIAASGTYLLRRQVNLRVLVYLLGGGLPGAVAGAVMMGHLKGSKSEQWILAVVGVIIAASAVSGLTIDRAGKRGPGERLHLLSPFALAIGLETGFSSAGAGALGSIMLLNLTSLAPVVVVGTDLWFGLITSATGGMIHAFAGFCNWIVLAKLVPAGIAGSIAGATLSPKLPAKALRTVVLLCAASVGILLVVKAVWSTY